MVPGILAALFVMLAGWTESPMFRHLFTPLRVPDGTYQTYVSPHPIDEVLAGMEAGVAAQPLVALEAFGQSGGYDRWKLARLYGAKRAKVARLPRVENGRVKEAWTLISPYPDPAMERLEPGTLLIVLRLPRPEP
jgi:hypothetical protein